MSLHSHFFVYFRSNFSFTLLGNLGRFLFLLLLFLFLFLLGFLGFLRFFGSFWELHLRELVADSLRLHSFHGCGLGLCPLVICRSQVIAGVLVIFFECIHIDHDCVVSSVFTLLLLLPLPLKELNRRRMLILTGLGSFYSIVVKTPLKFEVQSLEAKARCYLFLCELEDFISLLSRCASSDRLDKVLQFVNKVV